MASSSSCSLHTNLLLFSPPPPSPRRRRGMSINCGGPRSNRGPLVKGRILSIEAIHAIQALKRTPSSAATILPRLIKADLLSTFKELLRQHHYNLALTVFSAIRAEYNPDLTVYADLVNGLASKGLVKEIDDLVGDMKDIDCDDKGLVKLVKALVEAQRREAMVRVYELMKNSGWGSASCSQVDEYVAEVLTKGLRRMGEETLADQIDEDVERSLRSSLSKSIL